MAKKGRYYNTEPSPENLRAIWDQLHRHTDLFDTNNATIADQATTITQLQSALQQVQAGVATNNVNIRRVELAAAKKSTTVTPGGGQLPPPPGSMTIPDHYADTVLVVQAATPVDTTSAGTIFKFVQRVAWALNAEVINGTPFPLGLLLKGSGDNIYTCGGETYSISRVCYPDGHIFKVLGDAGPGGNNTPQWVDDGFVTPDRYHIATDPALPC